MKRIVILLLLLILAACAQTSQPDDGCPEINIPRETARIYQNNGEIDQFQINLVGYEGYCYTEPSNNRRYAVLTPLFKVRRLEDSPTSSLDVDFYIKTSINAEDYLGTRKFSQTLNIPQGVKEKTIKGRVTKTRLATPPYNGFSLDLGIALSDEAKTKTKKMFDIDYRYLSAEEIAAQNETAVEKVYLEVNPDEEVIYSDFEQTPLIVKKNRPKTNCQD